MPSRGLSLFAALALEAVGVKKTLSFSWKGAVEPEDLLVVGLKAGEGISALADLFGG